MELFFIIVGVFAILLVIYLIIKDFQKENGDKVHKEIKERKAPLISSQHYATNKSTTQINKKQVTGENETKGYMAEFLGLIVVIFILIIMISSCSVGGGSNYQPGDFDFDGDSGDLDDAIEFLEWKMNQEE